MEKEPGQTAWLAYAGLHSPASTPQWHELPTPSQRAWAAVEAAVLEKAAMIAEAEATELAKGGELEKSFAVDNVAQAIRAAGRKPSPSRPSPPEGSPSD